MQEFIQVGLVFCAVVSLILSKILLSYGKSIDQHPAGGQETREKSLASPRMFTQLSVLVFWLLFIVGSVMVFQQSRFMLVGGIALITGLVLYLGTAVVFSAAVLSSIARAGREGNKSNPFPGVMGTFSPFSSKQAARARSRSRGKNTRPGYPGYRK